MGNWPFNLYLLYVISVFLHIPARFPALGLIRFDLLLVCLILGSLLIGRRNSGQQREPDAIGRMLLILIGYVVLTIPFVEWPGSVIKNGIPEFIKAVIFFYFTVLILDNDRKLRIFMLVFVGCQLFRVLEPLYLHLTTGYWGSVTHLGGSQFAERLSGSPYDVINPNGLAFVVVTVIIFLHYLTKSLLRKYLLVYYVMLPALIYALVLTLSRTGFVALLAVVLVILWKSRHRMLGIAIVLVGTIIATASLTDIQRERYLSLFQDDVRGAETVDLRIRGWREDLAVALNKPIVGHGLGTSQEANYNVGERDIVSHNLYLEVLQELGVTGLFIFLLFLKSVISAYMKTTSNLRERLPPNHPSVTLADALGVWLVVNVITSIATYGLSSYGWYLLAGLIVNLSNSANTLRPVTPGVRD